MKPVKHFSGAAGIMVAAACLIALTKIATTQDMNAALTELSTRSVARSGRQAVAIGGRINQGSLDLDQTLLVPKIDACPLHINQDNTAPCGAPRFASMAAAAEAGLIPVVAVTQSTKNVFWIISLGKAKVRRLHAFKQISYNSFAADVAMPQDTATRSANFRRQQVELLMGGLTVLLMGLAVVLVRRTRLARQRGAKLVTDNATLTAANERLKTDLALASAKAGQLEATLAGMGDGVSMVDANLLLVEWNTQFPVIAGVPAEILRVGLPMEEILHAQVRTGQFGRIADPQAEVDRRMGRLRVAPFGVVQRQRPDGHTIELRRNRLPDGGFVTLYTDVTEQKRAEEALRLAQADAEAANAAKSHFVAIVSHEIRTPLSTLLNTMRLLDDSGLAPTAQSLVTVARQSGDALQSLVNDILNLSQIEAGKLSIRPSLFELRLLLEGCVEMFVSQGTEKGIRFYVDIAEGMPGTLLTDPARLRQVMLNLISNAVKYARPGDIRLIVEPGASPNEAVKLMVKDAGPRIGAEAQRRLFRPFSRLDRPDGVEMIGTGLGLSICSQLMMLLGGSIGCDSWVGGDGKEGNVFWIALPSSALPLHTERPTPCPATVSAAVMSNALLQRPLPRTRILLAEDVPANQLVTATLLRRQGHLVDIACSGKAAIEAARHTPYDLIFMDIFMPGIGGQEATQIIRTLPKPAGTTPIIALTASTSGQDEAAFKASGMDGLLGKPVCLAGLLNVLRHHVWAGGSASLALLQQPPRLIRMDEEASLLSSHRIKELWTNLSLETFADLVEEGLLDLDERLPALRQAVAEGASGAIIAQAHTMIGIAAGYGMAALETRLRAILITAREGKLLSIDMSATNELEKLLAKSAKSLRAIIQCAHV